MSSELDVPSVNQDVGPIPGLADTSPTTVTSELQKPENSQAQCSLQLTSSMSHRNIEADSGEWTSDDIPEFLNTIRKEVDAEKESPDQIGGDKQKMKTEQEKTEVKAETELMVKTEETEVTIKTEQQETEAEPLAAPPPLDPWAKLLDVRLKNPVSGLTEYARYLHHTCEFLHLNYSGPSHRPRFRVQVKLNGRTFPVAEGSSKKNAKRDAAAIALRRIMAEVAQKTGNEVPDDGNDQLQCANEIVEEPCKAPPPKKRRVAPNKVNKPRPAPGMGRGRGPPFGSDYPCGNYREPGFGGSSNFPICDMNPTLFPDDVNHYPGRNGTEGVGPLNVRPHTMVSDDFQRSHEENYPTDKPSERPGLMGTSADGGNFSDRIFSYLETFQIANESDAQQVLKVTQKLTDMLVEYRLKSGSAGSGPNVTPMSTSYSFQPSRLSSNSDRFSGQSSFSGGPLRFH